MLSSQSDNTKSINYLIRLYIGCRYTGMSHGTENLTNKVLTETKQNIIQKQHQLNSILKRYAENIFVLRTFCTRLRSDTEQQSQMEANSAL